MCFYFFRNLNSYFNLKCRENILSSKIKVQKISHNLLTFSIKKKKIVGFEYIYFFLAGCKYYVKIQNISRFAHKFCG